MTEIMRETSQDIALLDCGHPAAPDGIKAGYAIAPDGRHICYTCAGAWELNDALEHGSAVFYLTNNHSYSYLRDSMGHYVKPGDAKITNWSGTVAFKILYMKVNYHNWAAYRVDVWFKDIMGDYWWGRQYGNFSELCYCRRIKKMWR